MKNLFEYGKIVLWHNVTIFDTKRLREKCMKKF